MSTTLLIVPSPGRCRSGIQSSRTGAPTMITTVPMARPTWRDEALVEDVPRVEAESGAHLQACAEPVEQQANVELRQPPRMTIPGHVCHSSASTPPIYPANRAVMAARTRPIRGTMAAWHPSPVSAAARWPRCFPICVRSVARSTRRCATRSPRSSWTAGSRPRPGCRPSASWPPPCTSAGRRSPPPTTRCARPASWPAAPGRAATSPCRPGRGPDRRWPGGAPAPTPSDVIDLSCAALAGTARRAAGGAARRRRCTAALRRERGLRTGRPARAARGDRATGSPSAACRPAPEQILVSNGAMHALDLLLQLLIGPGDRVLTELPTYPGAIDGSAPRSARASSPCRWPRPAVGTSPRCGRRCARPRRGWPTSSPTSTTRPARWSTTTPAATCCAPRARPARR